MSRILRLGRYFSWTVLDQFISMGIPRLILFPVLARMVGADTFGSFVLALGAILMVGLAPSNGLINYVIRDLVRVDEKDQPVLIRTTLVLSFFSMVAIALIYAVGSDWIAGAFAHDPVVAKLLPWLALYLMLTNVVETSLAAHRVRRRFGRLALIHGLQTALTFLAIPMYYLMGITGVAVAHFFAAGATLGFVLLLERPTLLQRPLASARFARQAIQVWPALSVAAVLTLSAGYLDRTLLGHWWPPSDPTTETVVTTYFAAASMAALMAVPGTLLANTVLSLLGRVREADQLDRRFYSLYLLGVGAAAMMVFVVGWAIGPTLIRTFYPDVAAGAIPLWPYVMLGFAIFNFGTLCRPFASKFLSPLILPLVSVINFVARLTPLALLVPQRGAAGAAEGLLIGASLTSLVWTCLYVKSFLIDRRVAGVPDDETLPREP